MTGSRTQPQAFSAITNERSESASNSGCDKVRDRLAFRHDVNGQQMFTTGQTVVRRCLHVDGRIATVQSARVVRDTADGLLLWVGPVSCSRWT